MAYHYLEMLHAIMGWFVSALALFLVAQIIPGIQVRSFGTALIATIVIALVNGTVGIVLKILTFPLTLITLGLFLLVVNALLLKLSSMLVPGFKVHGFLNALIGSIVLTILNTTLRYFVF
jgi:putative membrane protein